MPTTPYQSAFRGVGTDKNGRSYSRAEHDTASRAWFKNHGSRVPSEKEASDFIGSLLNRDVSAPEDAPAGCVSFKSGSPTVVDSTRDGTIGGALGGDYESSEDDGEELEKESDWETRIRKDPMANYEPVGESASTAPSILFGSMSRASKGSGIGSFKRPNNLPGLGTRTTGTSSLGTSSLSSILASMSLAEPPAAVDSEEEKIVQSKYPIMGSQETRFERNPLRRDPLKHRSAEIASKLIGDPLAESYDSWSGKFLGHVAGYISEHADEYGDLAFVFVPSEAGLAKDMKTAELRNEGTDFVSAHVGKSLRSIKAKGNIVGTIIRTGNGREWTLGATKQDGLVLKTQQNFRLSHKLKGTDSRTHLSGTSVDVKYCYLDDDATIY